METGLRGDDLAYATLDYIREHPEEWDQRSYWCGSTACFIGRALTIAWDTTLAGARERHWAGTGKSPTVVAAELLGWTPLQAAMVSGNGTEDFTTLEHVVKGILNGTIA